MNAQTREQKIGHALEWARQAMPKERRAFAWMLAVMNWELERMS